MRTRDPFHQQCRDTIEADPGPLLISTASLAEIGWMLEQTLPPSIETAFLADIRDGLYRLSRLDQDVPRIMEIVSRYHDLRLGLTDAAVIVCAERHGGKVLTTDRRHFPIVARGEGTLTVLP